MRVVLFGLLWSVYACTGELRIVSSSSTVAKDTCDATEGSCEEIGECSNCDDNAGCIYNKGGFKCQCNAGYEGDGNTCTDINECTAQLCNGKCINTDGSYECQCNTGYILAADGHTCIIDPCIPNACKTSKPRCMTDEQVPKIYRCFCPNGKVGDKCQHLGPCETAEKRCGNGTCIQVDDVGKYRCDCFKGYVGFYCEFKDHCIAKACKHGGKCQSDQKTGGFICDCHHTGYVGPTCNHIDVCINPSNPCKNGGLCTMDSFGKVVCICADGFKGKRCEIAVTNCNKKPCNNGKCKVDDGKVKCSCGKKYMGEYCEITVTCADHPCEHDGVCIDNDDGSYSCSCRAGYSGSNCEIIELPCGQDIFTDLDLKDQCASNKCPSQQKCMTDTDGNALCFCKPGLSGNDCLDKVTSCEQVVCLHDGKCIDENGTFHCNCAAEYEGANCENRVGGEILYPPHKKYFCPVVQTIGERGGCRKCSASLDNCPGCCGEKNATCLANCQRLAQFCDYCTPGQPNYEQCNGVKTKCPDPSCDTACSQKATNCINGCTATDDTTDATEVYACPKVYTCPKEPPSKSEAVTGYQCQALKYPSGKIECVYVTVPVNKEDYHSYIMFPRINFAGKVQIDSATLNNVFDNFDINTFAPANKKITPENWNPSGSSNFRLVDVFVKRVCHKEGLCVYIKHNDRLIAAPITGQANGKVAAKIVDLDVEVQGRLSEIYGLSIDVGGFFKADMEPASFQSLWYKMIDEPNDDYGQGSRFQSVLTNVQFSAKYKDSKIVKHLKENIGPNQQLSICFNIDLMGEHPAFNYSFARIVGSIGLAGEKAPHFFNYGRLLRRLPAARELSHAPFTVDGNKKKIYIDLGNSLAIGRNGYILNSVGQLQLGVYAGTDETGVDTPNCLDKITWISRIYYTEYGGYIFTAGISVIDIPSHLEHKLDKQFVLAKIDEGGTCLNILLAENKEGINVRPYNSRLVFRAQHEDVIHGNLFVTIFGKKPTTTTNINLKLETADSIIRDHPLGPAQPFGLFKDTVDPSIYNYYFYAMNDPNNIRKIIDGQIYALQYTFNGYPLNPDRNEAMNSAICIHVYDEITPSDQPTWVIDILPIFQLYANLFPVMRSFVDLGDYNSVVEKKCHILTTMSLDFQDPQYMPVTRDLSPKKTEMILKWLDDDKPDFGLTHHARLLTKQHLLNMLQTALELEHATIPIYMNGFLSIKPWQNEEVKKMLHQIIVDEMFHFAQVANIINGLGGRPYLLGNTFVPAFPSHLPGGCRPNMIASINKISSQQVHDVYMEIEEPSYVLKDHELVALINKISTAHLHPATEASEGGDYAGKCGEALKLFPLPNKKLTETNHNTIGDLYMAVVYILGQLSICGKKDIFTGKTKQLEWPDRKHLRVVNDFDSALGAIKAIVDQGEGASAYNPLQQNVDSSELAHYFKFSSIFHGRQITTFNVTNEKVFNNNEQEIHDNYVYLGDKISFFETGVWPMVNDPQMSKYKPDSQAYKNAQAFNDVYRKLLETLQSVFDGNVDRFDDAFGLMKSLIVYGMRVVQTPIEDGGDPNIGPNAGPTYSN